MRLNERVTLLEIKYAMLDDKLEKEYIGKELNRYSIDILKNSVRLTNCLIQPIDPCGFVDDLYEAALVAFGFESLIPATEFCDTFFSEDNIEEFLSKNGYEIYRSNGKIKYLANKEKVVAVVDHK